LGLRDVRLEPRVLSDVMQIDTGIGNTVPMVQALTTTVPTEPPVETSRTAALALPSEAHHERLLTYLALVVVCALLGAMLAKFPAFQEARLVSGKLAAAVLPQFLSAGGVIAFLWIFGRAVALRFRTLGGPRAVLCDLLTPLITLFALVLAYFLLQRPLAPLLDENATTVYGRCFLLATCACAVWTSMVVFSHAEPLRRLLHDYRAATRVHGADAGRSAWAPPKEK
jgi:hypothetical protein